MIGSPPRAWGKGFVYKKATLLTGSCNSSRNQGYPFTVNHFAFRNRMHFHLKTLFSRRWSINSAAPERMFSCTFFQSRSRTASEIVPTYTPAFTSKRHCVTSPRKPGSALSRSNTVILPPHDSCRLRSYLHVCSTVLRHLLCFDPAPLPLRTGMHRNTLQYAAFSQHIGHRIAGHQEANALCAVPTHHLPS